jgi:hypothetical protein
MMIMSAVADVTTGEEHAGDGAEHEEDLDPYAVLFPWFVVAIGTLIYYCTTRYFHKVPYTAIMFLIGALMGKLGRSHQTYLICDHLRCGDRPAGADIGAEQAD